MDGGIKTKNTIITGIGIAGSLIASALGGWDSALITLLIFMAVDYVTGLIVAGVFHNSPKSESGLLESKAGLKGLFRKGMVLVIVLIAARLDVVIGADYIRNAVCITFICNETISIIENAGLMGVPIPEVVTKAIDVLKNRSEVGDENE